MFLDYFLSAENVNSAKKKQRQLRKESGPHFGPTYYCNIIEEKQQHNRIGVRQREWGYLKIEKQYQKGQISS